VTAASLSLPLAHGIGAVKDLPLPLWLFYYTGAIVLVVSFVALGVLWTKPRLENNHWERPLPGWLQRILLSTVLRVVFSGFAFFLLVLVFLAALIGEPSQGANLAPTFVFVIFWVGMVPLVVLFGNVWRVLNPWRAAADGVAWLAGRLGVTWEPLARYPERLGRWPAAALLFAFTAYELAYLDSAEPRSIALAILIYSWISWVGAAVFGRETWFENCDGFTLYFGFLSRIAVFGKTQREDSRDLVLRPPFAALARWDVVPGTLAVVAVMLGSVAFDGFNRTATWQNRLFRIEAELINSPGLSDFVVALVNLAGLTVFVLLVAGFYLLAVAGARAVAHSERPLVSAFVYSLVPIALAYALAHYFSLLVNQGQFAIPLASDPFGFGWDVLGTSDYAPNLTALTPNMIWYTQVGVLIAGHVAGLVLAHDRAIALFSSSRTAVRTQYAFLILMVLYTVGGLWLLSQG
jgi:hypothetical protein